MPPPNSLSRKLLWAFRLGIFALACMVLYAQLFADKGNQALLASLQERWTLAFGPMSALVLLLVPVNWGLEATKWRLLVAPVARVERGRAFLATIAGTAVGLITPNRTGEFVGRVLFLPPEGRVAAAFATALGGMSQFVVTLVAGGLGLLVLTSMGKGLPWGGGAYAVALATLTTIVALGVLVLYLFPGFLRQLVLLVPLVHRLEKASAVLTGYSRSELLTVLVISAVRYLVFLVQFLLFLDIFGSGVPIRDAAFAIPVVYLVSTLVPTVMLTELGVRGSVALALLDPLGGAAGPVLLATFALWLVNLVLPAAVGSLLLLTVAPGRSRS